MNAPRIWQWAFGVALRFISNGSKPHRRLRQKQKGSKKAFAREEVHFFYDSKKGGLYFNENGSDQGLGNGGIAAIIQGAPSLRPIISSR